MRYAIILLIVLAVPALCFSATLVVPDDHPIISNAIDRNNENSSISAGATVSCPDIEGGWPGMGKAAQEPVLFDAPDSEFHLQQHPGLPMVLNPRVDAGDPTSPMIEEGTGTVDVQDAGTVDSGPDDPSSETTDPIPDIKANLQDGPLTIPSGTELLITVSLDPGSKTGNSSDWWILMFAPFPPPADVWHFNFVFFSYLPGFFVSLQFPLFNIPLLPVFNDTSLPPGTYYFFFIVDLNMNGVLDEPLYLDFVQVNIQ